MKRKELPTIDIAQSVMQRIKRDDIRMRSSRHFRLRNAVRKSSLIVAVALSCLGFLSLGYVLKNDVFLDYRSLASQSEFIGSLPWPGIVITLVSIVAVIAFMRLVRKQSPNFRISYALGVWAVLIVGVLGVAGSLSPEHTPEILARTAYFSDKDPSKVYGEVLEVIDAKSLKAKVGDTTFIVFTDTEGVKTGDKILILGEQKGDKMYADALKVVEKAPENKVAQKEEAKPAEEPKPVEEKPKPIVTPKPVEAKPAPAPAPAPAPPEPTKAITIIAVGGPLGSSPRKFQIDWSSNFTLENGYKLIWEISPTTPTWPTSNYRYDGTASSSGTNYVKDTMGPGTYNVRLCQYFPDTSTCGVYSNQITVTFP